MEFSSKNSSGGGSSNEGGEPVGNLYGKPHTENTYSRPYTEGERPYGATGYAVVRKGAVWVAAAILIVMGSIFAVVGLAVRSSIQPFDDGILVEGVVVGQDAGRDSDGGSTYRPVVEYQDPNTGETFTVVGSVGTNSQPTLGETKTVSFRPESPSDARVIDDQWFPWVFIVIGGFLLLGGLIMLGTGLTKARRRRPVSNPVGTTEVATGVPIQDSPQDGRLHATHDVFQPFGDDEGPIQDGSTQSGPIEGGPLK